jgi:protein TonB
METMTLTRALFISLAIHIAIAVNAYFGGPASKPRWAWTAPVTPIWVSPAPRLSRVAAMPSVPEAAQRESPTVEPRLALPSQGTVSGPEGAFETVVPFAMMAKWGNAAPYYPELALARGWQGQVKLRLEFGELKPRVWVLESSGHAILDEAALTAAKHWHRPEGIKTARVVVPIDFQLED